MSYPNSLHVLNLSSLYNNLSNDPSTCPELAKKIKK